MMIETPQPEKFEPDLEKAIAGGFIDTMQYLHAPYQQESIAGYIKDARTKEIPADIRERLSIEAETNALAGHFVEHIWPEIKSWTGKHPGELGRFDAQESGPREWHAVSLQKMSEEYSSDPRQLLRNLLRCMSDTMQYQVLTITHDYREAIEEAILAPAEEDKETREMRNFERYSSLLEALNILGEPKARFFGRPENQLASGFGNAALMNLAILGSSPELYRKKYVAAPDATAMNKLIDAGRDFALQLATTHIDIFSIVRNEIVESILPERRTLGRIPLPFLQNVYLREKNGSLMFDVEEQALRRIASNALKLQRNGSFTTCPAIAARDTDNIVRELYDWTRDLVGTYYYPIVLKTNEW